MRLATKLDEWQAAGLIDAGSAAAILAHEDASHRPVALFAVAGLGLLALALGIVSLIAANWDAVPPAVKLSANVALIAIAAIGAFRFARDDRPWLSEGALFLLAALTLAGIALQSQIYQLTGALWQALGWWAVLLSPALLLLGRTRLVAYCYALMLMALAVAYCTSETIRVGQNLAAALPAALVLAGLGLPDENRNAAFRSGLVELGLAAALLGASLAQIAWSGSVTDKNAGDVLASLPLAALLVAIAAAFAFHRRGPGEAALIAFPLVGSLLAVLLALGIPHGGGLGPRFAGVLTFAGLWGGMATVAARARWHRLFQVAVAALAARLFAVYFELFYSLAFTGTGLIIAGALLIGLTWLWARIVRREAR